MRSSDLLRFATQINLRLHTIIFCNNLEQMSHSEFRNTVDEFDLLLGVIYAAV